MLSEHHETRKSWDASFDFVYLSSFFPPCPPSPAGGRERCISYFRLLFLYLVLSLFTLFSSLLIGFLFLHYMFSPFSYFLIYDTFRSPNIHLPHTLSFLSPFFIDIFTFQLFPFLHFLHQYINLTYLF